MEITLRLSELILSGLIIVGYGKFLSLLFQIICESIKDKIKNKKGD